MGIGDFVSNLFGSTNKATTKAPTVDPNAYQYGGAPGDAARSAANYANQASAAQGRAAPQAANVGVDFGQANSDASQAQQARQGQSAMANVLGQRATGGAPTIAQMQADHQMQQAQAGQASMAASARGAGALANSQRNAANNVANTQANISGQAQVNGAQEVLNNTNAATAAYGALRGGDQASQGQDASQAQFSNQSAVNQGQFNATQQSGQNALNDAMTQNMTQNAIGVNNSQLTAGMNQQAQQSANSLGASGINAGVAGQNASMNQSNAMSAVGMGQSAAGAIAGALAKGGPADSGKPYLVGEKGPELIVPKKDGYVLTADQTQQELRGTPSSTVNALFAQRSKDVSTPSLASVLDPRCAGGPMQGSMPARADGGPVQSGGAQSTWGTGQEHMANMAAFGPAWDAAMASRPAYTHGGLSAAPMAPPVAGFQDSTTGLPTKSNRAAYEPLQQADQDTVAKHDAQARYGALPTNSLFGHEGDDEQKKYETAKYRADSTAKGDKKEASEARKSKLQSVLGDMGTKSQESARGVDTSYHGASSHYGPPSLIALPARADGGPIMGGGELDLGSTGGRVPLTASMGSKGPQGVVGGGGITGGMGSEQAPGGGGGSLPSFHSGGGAQSKDAAAAVDTQYHPTGGGAQPLQLMPLPAREDGGPVDAGGAANKAAKVAEYAHDRGYGGFAPAKGEAQTSPPRVPESEDTRLTREDQKFVSNSANAYALLTPLLGPIPPIGYSAMSIGMGIAAEQKAARDREEAERKQREAGQQSHLAQVLTPRPQ